MKQYSIVKDQLTFGCLDDGGAVWDFTKRRRRFAQNGFEHYQ